MSSDHHYEDRCIMLMPNQSHMGQKRNRQTRAEHLLQFRIISWMDGSCFNIYYTIFEEPIHLTDMSRGGKNQRKTESRNEPMNSLNECK